MIQNKIKLTMLQFNKISYFFEGIRVTHDETSQSELINNLLLLEKAINKDPNLECEVKCISIELK